MDEININDLKKNYSKTQDLSMKVELGLKIIVYYYSSVNFSESLKYGIQILPYAEKLADTESWMQIIFRISLAYSSLGEYDKASEYYKKLLQKAESENNEQWIARTCIYLAKIEYFTAGLDIQKELEYLMKAEELSRKNNWNSMLFNIYTQFADTYLKLGQYHYALDYYKKSFKMTNTDTEKASTMFNLSRLYSTMNDLTLALGYAKRSLTISEKIGIIDKIIPKYALIGQIYQEKEQYELAVENLTKAFNYYEENKIIVINFFETCKNLANTYTIMKNFDEAQIYYDKFLENEMKLNSEETKLNFYKNYSEFNMQIGNYLEAYTYLSRFQELNYEKFNDEMKKNMSIMTANLEYEHKKKEAELLKQKNTELEEYQKIIEQKNTELLQMHTDKDNLMNTISHDLKNYIGAALQALELAIMKDENLKNNKYIIMSEGSNSRAINLVKEILYATKLEASKDTLNLKEYDLNEVIAEAENVLSMRAKNKNISVVCEYHHTPLKVKLDMDKWHRVFENLTTNAIKFTNDSGTVTIKTQQIDNFAMVSIKDSGIGITPENIPKLFQQFSGVGRKGTAGEESTGLGLSIVKKLVEMHGGTIDVKSEVGVGTEFFVKLGIV